MINNIIAFSVRNKLIIGLFTLLLIGWGVYSVTQISVNAVPDITNNQVQVITVSQNLAAQEVEQFITQPVELSLNNLPGVTNIRSISRFGLSVVTVVFEDNMGIYKPRQLVSEKLKQAQSDIADGLGTPEMVPITTGLGEIYQYTVETKPGYENQYNATELRTIQDWIIQRQLSGIPGVVEINSTGGYLKEYEIAVDPNKLNGFNLTIADLYSAIEANNQNTGGSYIEKGPELFYVRGRGLVGSLDDIRKTVITTRKGIPITIGDVAIVQIGHANRYGAATMNGEGETVVGIIMMLRGASSMEVIANVKKRIEEVQSALPEGIVIKPFLDRSALIDKTTSTIEENLLIGGLIVIFALVFLLGTFRAGLIVASIIPLSMLFALSMMNTFGVSANLMSLGALDFGIIVDGAVIIVEFMAVQLSKNNQQLLQLTGADKRKKLDDIAEHSAGRMMNAATFGQIIILIVFVPILALQGVEGKMFIPMALAFSFAILGAIVLCLTYVPMMCALFLYGKSAGKKNIGDKFMEWLDNKVYQPVIKLALRLKLVVVLGAIVLLVMAVYLFSTMGGEFIPKLQEGDFALEVRMSPGTSLQEMKKSMGILETILLNKFSEVEKIVTKIGAAEVPTDPAPIEGADIMVALKPKGEWESNLSYEELANDMNEALSVLPGVSVEFSQPIEMRFNELLSGVKSDLAVKIYGEDLQLLQEKGNEAANIIRDIKGAADVRPEQVAGLPQIVVDYNRDHLARYGLNIKDINTLLSSALSGATAGQFYQGEKRFDIVIRLKESFRQDIASIRNLYVPLPSGEKLPLKEVASVKYEEGPNQISRDNTHRRIVVGVNVRNRDIQSLVDEIKQKLNQKLKLPAGYYISYGGDFENLQRASKRLSLVVPMALALIFIILYISLRSFKQTLLIYTAIPFAAVGGVFALWLRGMPFSISAGIGFIALFGVAVLNGLVLISYLNDLKADGVSDIRERIIRATRSRLRPIFLTATVDILGFLPMAVSTSNGAEVQRPLATVVIGGILTATMLTLIVLPVLYNLMELPPKIKKVITSLLVMPFLILPTLNYAQTNPQVQTIRLKAAIDTALANNPGMIAEQYRIEAKKAYKGTAVDLPKTNFDFQYGKTNSFYRDNGLTISQNFAFPTYYVQRSRLLEKQVTNQELKKQVTRNALINEVKSVYYYIRYVQERSNILSRQDSIYRQLVRATRIRFKVGEAMLLENTTAVSRFREIENSLKQNEAEIQTWTNRMQILLNSQHHFSVDTTGPLFYERYFLIDSAMLSHNPSLLLGQQSIAVENQKVQVAKARALPDFNIGYVNQSNQGFYDINGTNQFVGTGTRFQSIQAGISIPLWSKPYHAQIRSAKLNARAAEADYRQLQQQLQKDYISSYQEYQKLFRSHQYYENTALPQAQLILDQSDLGFKQGEISYLEYINGVNQAMDIQFNYLNNLNQLNQAIISIEYLLGNQSSN